MCTVGVCVVFPVKYCHSPLFKIPQLCQSFPGELCEFREETEDEQLSLPVFVLRAQ